MTFCISYASSVGPARSKGSIQFMSVGWFKRLRSGLLYPVDKCDLDNEVKSLLPCMRAHIEKLQY